MRLLLKCTEQSTFKHLILSMLLNLCLFRNMSVPASDDLRDHNCKRRKVTHRPPIAYAQFMYKPWVTKPNKIKIKLLEGNTFQCNLMSDASNTKSYVKWILVFLHIMEEKKLDKKLVTCLESLKKVPKDLKKHSKVPKKESMEQKAEWELEGIAAKVRSAEAHAEHATAIGACYDLFHQLLAVKHQVQWDRIIMELQTKATLTGLDKSKYKGLCMKTCKSLED